MDLFKGINFSDETRARFPKTSQMDYFENWPNNDIVSTSKYIKLKMEKGYYFSIQNYMFSGNDILIYTKVKGHMRPNFYGAISVPNVTETVQVFKSCKQKIDFKLYELLKGFCDQESNIILEINKTPKVIYAKPENYNHLNFTEFGEKTKKVFDIEIIIVVLENQNKEWFLKRWVDSLYEMFFG